MNMIRNALFLSVLGLLLQVSMSFGYGINYSVWRLKTVKGPIRVLLLGDAHQNCPEDKSHKRIVIDSLKRLNKRTTQTVVLTEAPEVIDNKANQSGKDFDQIAQEVLSDDTSKLLIGVGELIRAQEYGSIKIVPGDIRSTKLYSLLGILQQLMGIKDNKFDEVLKYPYFANASFPDELFEEANRASKRADDLCAIAGPELREIVQKLQIQLHKGMEEARLFLKEHAEKGNCGNAFVSFFKKNKNAFQYFSGSSNWVMSLITPISDIGFFEKFNRSIGLGKDIIFLAGAAHAVQVYELMQKLENKGSAKCIAREGVFLRIADFTGSFYQSADPLSDAKLKVGLHLFENTCFVCHKTVEAMKTCGACKVAKYCSADCQKKDWPLHKSSCRKK